MKWTQFCVHWFSATSEHLHYSGACDRTDIYGMMGGLIRPRRLVDGLVDGSNIVLPEFCSHWKLNLWWVVSIDTSRYSGLQYSAQYVITRYFHLRQQYAHRHINIIWYIYIEEYSMHNYIWTETKYTYIYIYPFIYIHAHDMNIIKCLLRFGEITSSDYQWRQWLISGTVPVSAPFAWHRPVMPCRRPATRQFWVMMQIVLDNRSGKGTDHTYSVFALASYSTYGIKT